MDNPESTEAVALALTNMIFASEEKIIGTETTPDRDDILQTYSDCLSAVKGQKPVKRGTVKMIS